MILLAARTVTALTTRTPAPTGMSASLMSPIWLRTISQSHRRDITAAAAATRNKSLRTLSFLSLPGDESTARCRFSPVTSRSLHIPQQDPYYTHSSYPVHSINETAAADCRLPQPDIAVEENGATRMTTTKSSMNSIIRDIPNFIKKIPQAVHQRKMDDIEPGAWNDPVAQLFRRSDLPQTAWQQYAHFDSTKPYTRNLIATDHKTYTLLLLCWNPLKESPIHDHPCDGCWLQVLKGDIQEIRYNRLLECTMDIHYKSGQLSYITDRTGYHKVGNPSSQQAVTLHLYAPPFLRCHCWHSPDDPPDQPVEGTNVNYSEYGQILVV